MALIKAGQPLPPTPIILSLYGQPGTGKTSLALTADKPLLIDADMGAKRSVNKDLADTLQSSEWGDITSTVYGLNLADYNTVVIDSLTRLSDICYRDYANKNPKWANQPMKWSPAVSRELQGLFTYILSKGLNLVFVSHERSVGDDEKQYTLDATGSIKNWVVRNSDAIGYCHINNGQRVVDFNLTSAWYGKNPFALFTAKPIAIENGVNSGQLGKMIAAINDKFNALTAEQKAAIEKVKAQKDALATEVDAMFSPDLDGFVNKMKTLSPELKAFVAPLYKAKCEELGMVFDKARGIHVEVEVANG